MELKLAVEVSMAAQIPTIAVGLSSLDEEKNGYVARDQLLYAL